MQNYLGRIMDEIRFKLWEFFSKEHDLQLTDGQIDDIVMAVEEYQKESGFKDAVCSKANKKLFSYTFDRDVRH